MKVLVSIANFGTGNDGYLCRVLEEYRRMRHDVDIVVITNIPKNLGPDVEVVVGLPHKDPRSLPFAHKRIFGERSKLYDVFVYTEDDILITQHNIDAFLRVTDVLPENELAGFLRTETDTEGRIYFPDVHKQYHWDASSFRTLGGYSFAFFTNEHSGCYALTKHQLARAIASGGFLVGFHEGKYEPLETAATDPYVQCGFRKAICISHLEDFITPHLSNKYAGNGVSVAAEEVYRQLKALTSIGNNGKPHATLFPVETKVYHERWSKSYYELCEAELLSLVPEGTRNVLSIGCGWGATEERLIEKGLRVRAVPIDSVIAASAESRGVKIVQGDCKTVREKLANERFDCLLFSNILHLVRDPVQFLTSFTEFLAPGGHVVASVPNLSKLRRFSRWLRFRGHVANPKNYEESRMHANAGTLIRRWLRQTGLKPDKVVYGESVGNRFAARLCIGFGRPMLGSSVYISAFLAHKHSSYSWRSDISN